LSAAGRSPWANDHRRLLAFARGNSPREFGEQRPQRGGAGLNRLAQHGAALRQRRGQPGEQAVLAAQRRALGADKRQGQEVAVVAREPRPQPGAQERGFAGARGAEDHQQPRRRGSLQTAQSVHRLDDRGVAAEEDAGVRGFERFEAAIRRALAVAFRWPGEEFGVEPRFVEPTLQPPEAVAGEEDVLLLVRARKLGRQQHAVLAASQFDRLPGAFQLRRQVGDRLRRIGHDREQLLVERAGERVFVQAPTGAEPVRRDQQDHRLAAVRLLVQRPLPALARRDAAIRVEIEEDVVPAFAREPIAQSDGLEIVVGGMAEEDAGHRGRGARASRVNHVARVLRYPSLRGALATKQSRARSTKGAGGPGGHAAAPWIVSLRSQ
jgi:hypothetical protein